MAPRRLPQFLRKFLPSGVANYPYLKKIESIKSFCAEAQVTPSVSKVQEWRCIGPHGKSSDGCTDHRDPPKDLVNFPDKKGLEKDFGMVMIVSLVAVAMYYGFAGEDRKKKVGEPVREADQAKAFHGGIAEEDRKKLGELVREEDEAKWAKTSIGWNLFNELRGKVRVEQRDGLEVAYLPFKETQVKNYMHTFGEHMEPKQHKCWLRVMEAQIPHAYVEQDIAKELVILVVGQTGAGKSTQIDGMLNFLLGIKWEESVRFKMVDENQTVSRESLQAGSAASQTDAITAYKIPALKGSPVKSQVTIVDTPGFGDTRGLHFDHKLVDQMKNFFNNMSEHVNVLTGVCFVAPASAARLTESQQYVWNAILGLFGKDIAHNILLCFTFADGAKPQALAAVKAGRIPMNAFFKFNNSALFEDPNGPETDELSKMFWDMGKKNMSDFFGSLSLMQAKSLHLSKQVMDEREKLQNSLENLGPQVKLTLGYANSLQEQAEQFALFDDQLEGSKDFKVTVEVAKMRKSPTKNYTTTCLVCDWTCHKNCAIADDREKAGCCAMSDSGYCTECPRKCHWSAHQNLPYILEWYTETEERTLDELKAKYDEANQGKIDKERILNGLANDIQRSYQRLAQLIVRMKRCRERLNEIAMRPHTMPSEEYLQQMIENEKNNQRLGWHNRVRALEKLKNDSRLLKDAEDPEFSRKLVAELTSDQKVQRAARHCRSKRGSGSSDSWDRFM